jgi:hypothetical protein
MKVAETVFTNAAEELEESLDVVFEELEGLYKTVDVEVWAPAFLWLDNIVSKEAQLATRLVTRNLLRTPSIVEDICALDALVILTPTRELKAFLKQSNIDQTAFELLTFLLEHKAFHTDLTPHIQKLHLWSRMNPANVQMADVQHADIGETRKWKRPVIWFQQTIGSLYSE